ncbi:MAG: methyl-accepting chemotaxis protein [Syntrophorhabdales bacterium]|jgi:methyl-accepting chemotaxis protein
MALDVSRKGLSGKKLAEAATVLRPSNGAHNGNNGLEDDDFSRRREEARHVAQDKAKARTLAKQQQLAERIATATEQLASGVEEGSGAAEELNRSMVQIVAGAEQASHASEESRAAVNQIEKSAVTSAEVATETLSRVNMLKALIGDTTSGIDGLVQGVATAAEAAIATAKLIAELEKQSEEVGNIVQAVVRIADQTNLLALNAAIEAARAGEHGRGFAVVADEVRNLAEISERSAREIKDVVADIQNAVRGVAAEINEVGTLSKNEAEHGKSITSELVNVATRMDEFQRATTDIEKTAKIILDESRNMLKVAEAVASAALELGSGGEEARKGTEQQTKAFSEMSTAAQELSQTADELKNATDGQKSGQELASMAEELSATIEEASSASQQVARAIDQIKAASEVQAKETGHGTEIVDRLGAAAKQIEGRATALLEQSKEITGFVGVNKTGVDELITNVNKAGADNMKGVENIRLLDEKTRKIEKIVEAIINVTIQTNMLAVSGSIEAARAGEHGRGFSVVAGDIRNLANESAENADKIKDMVRALGYQITKCAQDTELAARTALSEAERAKASTANLVKVEGDMTIVEKAMVDALNGATEALAAIEQAKKGIEQIGAASEEASKAVGEAASAGEEQAKGLQELSQAIEEISSLADEMQNM